MLEYLLELSGGLSDKRVGEWDLAYAIKSFRSVFESSRFLILAPVNSICATCLASNDGMMTLRTLKARAMAGYVPALRRMPINRSDSMTFLIQSAESLLIQSKRLSDLIQG